MQTNHPPLYWICKTLLLAVCISAIVIGCDGITESTGRTYEQYVAENGGAWFEPKGASGISQRTSSTRDGYDAWWRFTISESDLLSVVKAVAKDEHGPVEIQLASTADPPSRWAAESEVPAWWEINGGKTPQSIHWCFKAGTAERHHGWLFVYNQDSNTAWCWHWNHQWSSDECP
jgi:hypothetical protein